MIKEKFERFRSLISAEPYNTDLDLFNKTKWFDEAWGTFQRTLFYMDPKNRRSRLRPEHKPIGKKRLEYEKKVEQVKNSVFKKIINEFPSDVKNLDNWYKQMITYNYGLSDKTPPFDYMSIGHRQKMVNILIKYFLTYFHTTKDKERELFIDGVSQESFKEFEKNILKNISHIHIPLDEYVLSSLYENEEYRKKFNGHIEIFKIRKKKPPCRGGEEGKKRRKDKDCPSYRLLVKGGEISWSRINNYDIYFDVQKVIRKLSEKEKMSPIEFEMEIWD